MNLEYKEKKLVTILQKLENCAIAFSGGTDSSLLLYYLAKLKINSKAYTFHSYLYPESALNDAICLAKTLKVNHEIININPLQEIENIQSNPKERCYLCKKYMFSILVEKAKKDKLQYIIEGSNFDDRNDFRPGKQAINELKILSPLDMAELTKTEIRLLLKKVGLNYSKPTFACYFSRFPYNMKVNEKMIKQISDCEIYIHNLGLISARVRYHNNIARIEANKQDMEELIINDKLRQNIIEYFYKLGFKFVTLDMEEYRTGSMNRTL